MHGVHSAFHRSDVRGYMRLNEERTHKGKGRGILCPPSIHCLIMCTAREKKWNKEPAVHGALRGVKAGRWFF